MSAYIINAVAIVVSATSGTLLRLAFGEPSQNDSIVRAIVARMEELALEGGTLCLLNGPASLPAACAIAHAVAHKFGAVGVFDPKMGGYVVAISHDPARAVGDFIPAADVQEG